MFIKGECIGIFFLYGWCLLVGFWDLLWVCEVKFLGGVKLVVFRMVNELFFIMEGVGRVVRFIGGGMGVLLLLLLLKWLLDMVELVWGWL